METRQAACTICGEEDYIDFMGKIDGAWHCQTCWHAALEKEEDRAILTMQQRHVPPPGGSGA